MIPNRIETAEDLERGGQDGAASAVHVAILRRVAPLYGPESGTVWHQREARCWQRSRSEQRRCSPSRKRKCSKSTRSSGHPYKIPIDEGALLRKLIWRLRTSRSYSTGAFGSISQILNRS
jgi:hypothetical protein